MATQLTERQKEIKRLLDQGKTPKEVGEALGISENAVYQHRRRINGGGASKAATPAAKAAKAASKPKRARQVVGPSRTPTAATDKAMTPLQAVRARREAIRASLSATQAALDAADKAMRSAQEAHLKATEKHADELAQLEAAEAALKGEKPPQRRGNGNRSRSRRATPAEQARERGEADLRESGLDLSGQPANGTTPVAEQAAPTTDGGPIEAPVELARGEADEFAQAADGFKE